MSAPEELLPRLYGDEVARSILARNLLVPVRNQLRDDGDGGLHRRCVLVSRLDIIAQTRDVCAVFSRFGAIEAVALCNLAVVVFRSADAADAALRAPLPEGPFGPYCEAVPSLDLGPEISCFIPSFIQVALNPPTQPPPVRPGASDAPTSEVAIAVPTAAPDPPSPFVFESWCSLGTDPREHARKYERALNRAYLGEPPEPEPPTVITTRFLPLSGPSLGEDGYMRIDGFKITEWRTATAMGSRTVRESRRVDEVASVRARRTTLGPPIGGAPPNLG